MQTHFIMECHEQFLCNWIQSDNHITLQQVFYKNLNLIIKEHTSQLIEDLSNNTHLEKHLEKHHTRIYVYKLTALGMGTFRQLLLRS